MRSSVLKAVFLSALLVVAGSAWGEVHEVQVRNMGSNGQPMVFEPALVQMAPGDTVRFVWKDMGHNASSYHPDNRGKPDLVPAGAKAWDSGFKQPGGTFEVTMEKEGVHHYFCLPHESMGMVGMVVVGDASKGPGLDAVKKADIPPQAKAKFRKLHGQLED